MALLFELFHPVESASGQTRFWQR